MATMSRDRTQAHGSLFEDVESDSKEVQPLLLSPHSRPYTAITLDENSPPEQSCEHPGVSNVKPANQMARRFFTWDKEGNVYQCVDFAGGAILPSAFPNHRSKGLVFTVAVMLLCSSAVWLGGALLCHASAPKVPDSHSSSIVTKFEPPVIQRSWAAYTPYFSVEPYTPPPSDCKITQVNIIQRHGARFPTSGATKGILAAVEKLQSATHYTNPRLNFLADYAYTLGKNDLVPFGAFQSEEAGRRAYRRYSRLISQEKLPFVRSSGGTRVVDSATNWTLGFSLGSHRVYNPPLSVILPENLNDTLDDSMCPNSGSSDTQTDIWTNIYGAPIAARLNAQAPGVNLTAGDISSLIPLCPFESVAKEEPSPFCNLFTPADFAQFEYFGDLDKFYGTGYGQALGPVQGVGYINELLARLTGNPVRDATQTNRTLDASPITFPLDRTLYADFSHDNQMIAIYSAMGLFKQQQPLDPAQPDLMRTWITSHLTPFSAQMVTERLTCTARHGTAGIRTQKSGMYVRILVNDALQLLEFCGGDHDGLCELGDFVKSQSYAQENGEGDFEKCFA